MTRRDLDRFVRAISGDPGAAGAIVADYADLLAGRFGALTATMPDADRKPVLAALAVADGLPGGVLAGLIAPPVAAHLLGRRNGAVTGTRLADELRIAAATAFDAIPQTVKEASWLTEQADTPETAWRPTDGPDVALGWDLLRRRVPGFFDLTRVSTRVVVHTASGDRSVAGSWSTDELIGCTVLVNAEPEPAWLAESLLHEAIHHLQGMVEARDPFIRDPALVRATERFASPWTGAPLTAKSLLAACFVWYALIIFAASADLPELAARATRGFIEGDPSAIVARYAAALDPDVAATVEDVQDRARHIRC